MDKFFDDLEQKVKMLKTHGGDYAEKLLVSLKVGEKSRTWKPVLDGQSNDRSLSPRPTSPQKTAQAQWSRFHQSARAWRYTIWLVSW